MYLITGAGGGVGSVSRRVVELLLDAGHPVRAMVHRDDTRADALRELGAEIVVGDLTNPKDVADALRGVERMFFNMSVSPQLLEATATVCAAVRERGGMQVLVNMSQMTVSQMTSTSTAESQQQRLHWLAEQVMNWSAVPVVHIRPTIFIENPVFTILAARSIRESGVLALPFGKNRTSPIAAADVARVVCKVLLDPAGRVGDIYQLTGPEVLDIDGLAEQFAQALHRPISGCEISYPEWLQQVLEPACLPAHTKQHLATVARLHREGRFDRATNDVERVTGQPAQTLGRYIAEHPKPFSQVPQQKTGGSK